MENTNSSGAEVFQPIDIFTASGRPEPGQAPADPNQFTGEPDLDGYLQTLSPEERPAAIQRIRGNPLDGKELWDKYQMLKSQGWRPNLEQFRKMAEYRDNADDEVLQAMMMGAAEAIEDFSTAIGSAIKDPGDAALKFLPSAFEALMQGTRDTYGMFAQSEDPGSILFKFKESLTRSGSIEDRYKQFLEAADFQVRGERLYSGQETLVVDERYLNPDFVRAMAYIAEPDAFIPFGAVVGKAARAAGFGAHMTQAALRAQSVKQGLLSGALEWGVGRPMQFVGGAVKDSIEFGLQKTSGALEMLTGIDAVDIARTARVGGAGVATASVAGYTVPFAAPVSVGYFGGGIVRGFGEATRLVSEQIRLNGGHRGLYSFAKEALRRVEADPQMAAKLSPEAIQMLKLIDKADPILSYAAVVGEGGLYGAAIGGALGYIHGQGAGFGAGVGQGAALGAAGGTLGRVVTDVYGSTFRMQSAIQGHFARRFLAEFDPDSAKALEEARSDPRASQELREVFDAISVAVGHVEGPVEIRGFENELDMFTGLQDFAKRYNLPIADKRTGGLTPEEFRSNEGWTTVRANGITFIGFNKQHMFRQGNKFAPNTMPHELFHAIVKTGIMGPHFNRLFRETLLGTFDPNTGEVIKKGVVDLNESMAFFKMYLKATEGANLSKMTKAQRDAYRVREKILESAMDKMAGKGPDKVLTPDEAKIVADLSEEFGAYYFSNFFSRKGIRFFLGGGKVEGLRGVLDNLKDSWLSHWESRLSEHENRFDFYRAQKAVEDGEVSLGKALEIGFTRDGKPVRLSALDSLMADMIKAGSSIRNRGRLNLADMSNETLKNFIEQHGLDELVARDSRGRARVRSLSDEVSRATRIGPEAFKLLNSLDPALRTSVTTPDDTIEGRLSPHEVEQLVLAGHMSQAMGDKLLLLYRLVDDSSMPNVVQVSYAGASKETTLTPGPRLRGKQVPVTHRELTVIDVITQISADGKFSFRVMALDNKVIRLRQQRMWSEPSVRAAWKDDQRQFNIDFHTYLANASKPDSDPTKVPSAQLWSIDGEYKRDVMHQVAGFAKAESIPYINVPIATIPRGVQSAVGEFSIGRMFNLQVTNMRSPYDHKNAFYPISQNFKPSTSDGPAFVMPNGDEYWDVRPGDEVLARVVLSRDGKTISTHARDKYGSEIPGTRFTGTGAWNKTGEALAKRGMNTIVQAEQKAFEQLRKLATEDREKASKAYQAALRAAGGISAEFTVDDLIVHAMHLPFLKNGFGTGDKPVPLKEHFVYKPFVALKKEGMWRQEGSSMVLDYSNLDANGNEVPASVRLLMKGGPSGDVVGISYGPIGSERVVQRGLVSSEKRRIFSDLSRIALSKGAMLSFLRDFDGKPFVGRGQHGSPMIEVFAQGVVKGGRNPKIKGTHFNSGSRLSSFYGRKGMVENEGILGYMDGGVKRGMSLIGNVGFKNARFVPYDETVERIKYMTSIGVDMSKYRIGTDDTGSLNLNISSDYAADPAVNREFAEIKDRSINDFLNKQYDAASSAGHDGMIVVPTGAPPNAIRYIAIGEVAPLEVISSNVDLSQPFIRYERAADKKRGGYYRMKPLNDRIYELGFSFPGDIGKISGLISETTAGMGQQSSFAKTSYKPATMPEYIGSGMYDEIKPLIEDLSVMFGLTDYTDRDGAFNLLETRTTDDRINFYETSYLLELSNSMAQLRERWEAENPLMTEEEYNAKKAELLAALGRKIEQSRNDRLRKTLEFRTIDQMDDVLSDMTSVGRLFMAEAVPTEGRVFRPTKVFDRLYQIIQRYRQAKEAGAEVTDLRSAIINSLGDTIEKKAILDNKEAPEIEKVAEFLEQMHANIGMYDENVKKMTMGLIGVRLENRPIMVELESGKGGLFSAELMNSNDYLPGYELSANESDLVLTPKITYYWTEKAIQLRQDFASVIMNEELVSGPRFSWSDLREDASIRLRIEQDPALSSKFMGLQEEMQEASERIRNSYHHHTTVVREAREQFQQLIEQYGESNYESYKANRSREREAFAFTSLNEQIQSNPSTRVRSEAIYYAIYARQQKKGDSKALSNTYEEWKAKGLGEKYFADYNKKITEHFPVPSLENRISAAIYNHSNTVALARRYETVAEILSASGDDALKSVLLRRIADAFEHISEGRTASSWLADEAQFRSIGKEEQGQAVEKFLQSLIETAKNNYVNFAKAPEYKSKLESLRDAFNAIAYEDSFRSGLVDGVEMILSKHPDGIDSVTLMQEMDRLNSSGYPILEEARISGMLDWLKENQGLRLNKQGKAIATGARPPAIKPDVLMDFVNNNAVKVRVDPNTSFDISSWIRDGWFLQPSPDLIRAGAISVKAVNKKHHPALGRRSHPATKSGEQDTSTFIWHRYTDRRLGDGRVVRLIDEAQAQNNLDARNLLEAEFKIIGAAVQEANTQAVYDAIKKACPAASAPEVRELQELLKSALSPFDFASKTFSQIAETTIEGSDFMDYVNEDMRFSDVFDAIGSVFSESPANLFSRAERMQVGMLLKKVAKIHSQYYKTEIELADIAMESIPKTIAKMFSAFAADSNDVFSSATYSSGERTGQSRAPRRIKEDVLTMLKHIDGDGAEVTLDYTKDGQKVTERYPRSTNVLMDKMDADGDLADSERIFTFETLQKIISQDGLMEIWSENLAAISKDVGSHDPTITTTFAETAMRASDKLIQSGERLLKIWERNLPDSFTVDLPFKKGQEPARMTVRFTDKKKASKEIAQMYGKVIRTIIEPEWNTSPTDYAAFDAFLSEAARLVSLRRQHTILSRLLDVVINSNDPIGVITNKGISGLGDEVLDRIALKAQSAVYAAPGDSPLRGGINKRAVYRIIKNFSGSMGHQLRSWNRDPVDTTLQGAHALLRAGTFVESEGKQTGITVDESTGFVTGVTDPENFLITSHTIGGNIGYALTNIESFRNGRDYKMESGHVVAVAVAEALMEAGLSEKSPIGGLRIGQPGMGTIAGVGTLYYDHKIFFGEMSGESAPIYAAFMKAMLDRKAKRRGSGRLSAQSNALSNAVKEFAKEFMPNLYKTIEHNGEVAVAEGRKPYKGSASDGDPIAIGEEEIRNIWFGVLGNDKKLLDKIKNPGSEKIQEALLEQLKRNVLAALDVVAANDKQAVGMEDGRIKNFEGLKKQLEVLRGIPFLEGKEYFLLGLKASLRGALQDGVDLLLFQQAGQNGTNTGLNYARAIDIYDVNMPPFVSKYIKKKGAEYRDVDYKLKTKLSPEQGEAAHRRWKEAHAQRGASLIGMFKRQKVRTHSSKPPTRLVLKPEIAKALSSALGAINATPILGAQGRHAGFAFNRLPSHFVRFYANMGEIARATDPSEYVSRMFWEVLTTESTFSVERGSTRSRDAANIISHVDPQGIMLAYLARLQEKKLEKVTDPSRSLSATRDRLVRELLFGKSKTSLAKEFLTNQGYLFFREDSPHRRLLDELNQKYGGLAVGDDLASKMGPFATDLPPNLVGFVPATIMNVDSNATFGLAVDFMRLYKAQFSELRDLGVLSPDGHKSVMGVMDLFDSIIGEIDAGYELAKSWDYENLNVADFQSTGHGVDLRKIPAAFRDEIMNKGQTAFKPATDDGVEGGADVSPGSKPWRSGFISTHSEKNSGLVSSSRLAFTDPSLMNSTSISEIVITPRADRQIPGFEEPVRVSAYIDNGTRTAVARVNSSDEFGDYTQLALQEMKIRLSGLGMVHFLGDFKRDFTKEAAALDKRGFIGRQAELNPEAVKDLVVTPMVDIVMADDLRDPSRATMHEKFDKTEDDLLAVAMSDKLHSASIKLQLRDKSGMDFGFITAEMWGKGHDENYGDGEPERAYVRQSFVDLGARGKGLGKILYSELGERLNNMGVAVLEGNEVDSFMRPYLIRKKVFGNKSTKYIRGSNSPSTGFRQIDTKLDKGTRYKPAVDEVDAPRPVRQEWSRLNNGTGIVVTSTDGYLISIRNKKFRLFDPERSLMGVYEEEEEAMEKARKHAERRRKDVLP